MKVKNTSEFRLEQGFTLLEVIISLFIAAILLSYAIPSFNNLILRSQITSYSNEFGTTVNLARSEAIKRGTDIAITSNAGTDWTQGWSLNVVSSGELLRTSPPLQSTSTTFNSGVINTVTFNSRGSTTLGAEETWSLCNANVAAGRRIRIAVTGRISVREITPCP